MGAFNHWLELTAEEIAKLSIVEQYIGSNNSSLAHTLLQGIDLATLIKYTELSETIKNFCDTPAQDPIWISHLTDFSCGEFLPRVHKPLIPSQLIKGMYFYGMAIEHRTTTEQRFSADELEFLEKSAENHCFYAYNSLSTWAYEQYKSNPDSNALLLLKYVKLASDFHWTPGYLLLYKTYLNLALLSENNQFIYQYAFEALLMAKKLSESEPSLDAINNAYFGKGIIAGNKSQFLSWDSVINETINKGNIPFPMVSIIYNRVSERAKSITTTDKVVFETPLPLKMTI